MGKIKSVYVCSECGYESPKWYGKCPGCGEWNTMTEEIKEQVKNQSSIAVKRRTVSSLPVSMRRQPFTDGTRGGQIAPNGLPTTGDFLAMEPPRSQE